MSASSIRVGASRWVQAWPDALAFAGGLAVAWWARWETTDLVWSLWLSSLVVGYATILWGATASLREFTVNASADKEPGTGAKLLVGGLLLVGSLFTIAFFTVHFGMFHFVHSVFLDSFFPVEPVADSQGGWPGPPTYLEVLRRYWIFLPAAFIAERRGFAAPSVKTDGSVAPAAIKGFKATKGPMMAPYKNVIRMHLLIFFFAGASFAQLDSFIVYAVVYAVYFFPWRLLKAEKTAIAT